jgi:hypothetical protein
VLPKRAHIKALPRLLGWPANVLAAGVRLPESECSHGTTIGKQRAPVNPRKPPPKDTTKEQNDAGPVPRGGTLSEEDPKAVGGVTIYGRGPGESGCAGHNREKIR